MGHTSHILTAGPERRRWQECVQRATPVQLWSMWALPVTSVIFISDGKCSGTHIAPHLHRDHTLQVAQLRTYMQLIHSMWCDYSHMCSMRSMRCDHTHSLSLTQHLTAVMPCLPEFEQRTSDVGIVTLPLRCVGSV